MSNDKLKELDLLLSQKEVNLLQMQENMSFLIKAQEELKKEIKELSSAVKDIKLSNNKF